MANDYYIVNQNTDTALDCLATSCQNINTLNRSGRDQNLTCFQYCQWSEFCCSKEKNSLKPWQIQNKNVVNTAVKSKWLGSKLQSTSTLLHSSGFWWFLVIPKNQTLALTGFKGNYLLRFSSLSNTAHKLQWHCIIQYNCIQYIVIVTQYNLIHQETGYLMLLELMLF